jgi:hypothetical protein
MCRGMLAASSRLPNGLSQDFRFRPIRETRTRPTGGGVTHLDVHDSRQERALPKSAVSRVLSGHDGATVGEQDT